MCKLEKGLQMMCNNGVFLFLVNIGEGKEADQKVEKIKQFLEEEIEVRK